MELSFRILCWKERWDGRLASSSGHTSAPSVWRTVRIPVLDKLRILTGINPEPVGHPGFVGWGGPRHAHAAGRSHSAGTGGDTVCSAYSATPILLRKRAKRGSERHDSSRGSAATSASSGSRAVYARSSSSNVSSARPRAQ